MIVEEIGVIFFEGILRILFVLLIKRFSSSHFIFKGWIFGVIVWFSCFAMKSLFQSPGLEIIPSTSVVYHFTAASIYGVALALMYKRLLGLE